MFGLGVALLVSGLPCLGYGFIDLVAPQLPIRWQVASTERHRGKMRGEVGQAFQRWLHVDPQAQPWENPIHRRQFRWIGLSLITTGLVVAGLGIAVIASAR